SSLQRALSLQSSFERATQAPSSTEHLPDDEQTIAALHSASLATQRPSFAWQPTLSLRQLSPCLQSSSEPATQAPSFAVQVPARKHGVPFSGVASTVPRQWASPSVTQLAPLR